MNQQQSNDQNIDEYIKTNLDKFDRVIQESKMGSFIDAKSKMDLNEFDQENEEKFDILELDEIETSLKSIDSPKMTFTSISNLVTLSLFYEDLFHERESVVQQTVCNSAVNRLNDDVSIYTKFVENLKQIQNAAADIYTGDQIDDEVLTQIGDSITGYINEQSIPHLNYSISHLESSLGLE